MAYIGAEPVPGQNREVDDISSGFNGNATAFTLQVSSVNVSPESANNILINLGGVLQNPGTDYTIAASTITFTTAPAAGLSFFGLILGAGINTATVADDTIGASKLIDTAVTAGSYTTADITVDAQGRITAAASGTIANAEIADGAVNNAKVNASAAIAGTKISPDFGSQNIVTTGTAATGALTVTGAITASTSITATNNLTTNGNFTISGTNPNIFLTDTNNDSDFRISNSNGILEFRDTTNSVTRFQIASDGTSTFSGDLTIPDTIVHTGDSNTKIRFPANDAISFETGGAEKARFNGGGVLFGTNTQRAGFFNTSSQFSPHFQIEGAGDSDDAGRTNSIIYNSTTNAGPVLIFGKTMGSSVGSTTAVTNGAQLGMISFQGLIGSEFTMGASITAQVAGSVGDNDLPTDLQFGTTSDGASSADEKMRLTAAGNLGIGTSSPSQKLQVAGDVLIDGAAGGTLTLGGSAAHTSKLVIADNSGSSNGNLLVEGGDGSDFFTINSAGNVKFEDNKKALFGAGADLELYHDSVGSIIQNQTGPLIIKGSGSNVDLRNSNDEIMIRANGGGAVDIRHANSVRLLTTSSGISFSGNDNSFNAGANAVNTTFVSAFGGAGATSVIRVKMNTSAVNGMQIQQAGSGTAVAGGNHAATVFNTENAKLRLGANNVEHFRIENNGDLKATDTSIGSLSDSRLKKNIVDFTYDLTKFKNLRPRIFDWINPELHLNQSQVRGFVAQEIETVDSTLVGDYTLYDETLTDKNPDLEIIKADDGTNIAKDSKLGTNDAMYISVIQQMLTKIETLETKVAALEAA